MKALTLYQPFAGLAAQGAKKIETRDFATSHRGLLAIHAAATFPLWARELCLKEPFLSLLREAGFADPQALPLGMVVAVAELADCREINEQNIPPEPERSLGDYRKGRYAWMLREVRQFSPVPAKGRQGLWDWYRRILAVSDIHGLYDRFIQLLEKAQYHPVMDQLVLLGDFIDRGPHSREVLRAVRELVELGAVAIRGNHEQMLLEVIEGRLRKDIWLRNGGGAVLQSYGVSRAEDLPAEDIAFIRSLPFFHETDNYVFVHAGLRPGMPVEKQNPWDLLWIRQGWLDAEYEGKTVVYGHTPTMNSVNIMPYKIALDTGAIFGGTLSAIELPGNTVFSV